MKEAIGGISIFQIVIVFVLVFTGVMCLTINHSKAFGVKDEIITILETEKIPATASASYKLNSTTISKIVDELQEAGYRVTGKRCPDSSWTGYNRNGTVTSSDVAFCVKTNDVVQAYQKDLRDKCKNNKCKTTSGDYPSMVYFDILLFYQLDIPVIKGLMTFNVYGSTRVLFG